MESVGEKQTVSFSLSETIAKEIASHLVVPELQYKIKKAYRAHATVRVFLVVGVWKIKIYEFIVRKKGDIKGMFLVMNKDAISLSDYENVDCPEVFGIWYLLRGVFSHNKPWDFHSRLMYSDEKLEHHTGDDGTTISIPFDKEYVFSFMRRLCVAVRKWKGKSPAEQSVNYHADQFITSVVGKIVPDLLDVSLETNIKYAQRGNDSLLIHVIFAGCRITIDMYGLPSCYPRTNVKKLDPCNICIMCNLYLVYKAGVLCIRTGDRELVLSIPIYNDSLIMQGLTEICEKFGC